MDILKVNQDIFLFKENVYILSAISFKITTFNELNEIEFPKNRDLCINL
jgi:hypothetical protein